MSVIDEIVRARTGLGDGPAVEGTPRELLAWLAGRSDGAGLRLGPPRARPGRDAPPAHDRHRADHADRADRADLADHASPGAASGRPPSPPPRPKPSPAGPSAEPPSSWPPAA